MRGRQGPRAKQEMTGCQWGHRAGEKWRPRGCGGDRGWVNLDRVVWTLACPTPTTTQTGSHQVPALGPCLEDLFCASSSRGLSLR